MYVDLKTFISQLNHNCIIVISGNGCFLMNINNNKISTYCFGRNKVCGDGDKKIRKFTIYFYIILYIIFALIYLRRVNCKLL